MNSEGPIGLGRETSASARGECSNSIHRGSDGQVTDRELVHAYLAPSVHLSLYAASCATSWPLSALRSHIVSSTQSVTLSCCPETVFGLL